MHGRRTQNNTVQCAAAAAAAAAGREYPLRLYIYVLVDLRPFTQIRIIYIPGADVRRPDHGPNGPQRCSRRCVLGQLRPAHACGGPAGAATASAVPSGSTMGSTLPPAGRTLPDGSLDSDTLVSITFGASHSMTLTAGHAGAHPWSRSECWPCCVLAYIMCRSNSQGTASLSSLSSSSRSTSIECVPTYASCRGTRTPRGAAGRWRASASRRRAWAGYQRTRLLWRRWRR